MPWQRLAADVAGELDPKTGLPAYREVILTIMRQSGKTIWVFSKEVERALLGTAPQRVMYTAQTGQDARKKLSEDHMPIMERSRLKGSVRNMYRAAGQEAIVFRNGSRIGVAASGQDSGHGFTVGLGVVDECWADLDDRREQAMVPAMATVADAQLLVVSTMGTDASIYLNRKVELGRHAAQTDKGSGICYLEWSLPPDVDIDDEEAWWEYMPALGWTITPDVIRHARQTMEEGEWRRAFGNQATKGAVERIIPQLVWEAVCDPRVEVDRSRLVVFAVDVLPDRSSGAIAVSDGRTVELIDHRPGVGWIVERLRSLFDTWNGRIVLDGGGPVASLVEEIEREGLVLEKLSTPDVCACCARTYDAISDHKVMFRQDGVLDKAVEGAARRPLGDRFIWSRQASLADVTPFFAASLAFGMAGDEPEVAFVAFD